ncbi:MAG: glycosyltransferase family 10 [Minisyncoccia bacterium]
MKDIFINFDSPALANNAMFKDDINNMNDPWKFLRDRFLELGYTFKTIDQNSLDNCTCVIFMDGSSLGEKLKYPLSNIPFLRKETLKKKPEPKRKLYQECLHHGLKDKMVLVLWEGKSVKPYNYVKSLHDKFSTILTWNDELVDNKKFFKFRLPIPDRKPLGTVVPFSQKKLLVNISFNKYSREKNELYSERRKSIEYFDSNFPDNFDLYGVRWNIPITRLQRIFPWFIKKYKTYRGHSKDKIETLSKYKFNICYENLSGTNGYITEKIFDSLQAGTVPVYWGAPNITDYIDSDTFIDRRKFNNNTELAKYLIKMKEGEYNKYILAGKRYLTSDKYIQFLPKSFCNRVIEILKLKHII